MITDFMDLDVRKAIRVSALWWLEVKSIFIPDGVISLVFVDSVKSSFTLNQLLTFCVLKYLNKKLISLVLFSPLSRKWFQSFAFYGIACPLFDIKILRPEMSHDVCVISFICLSPYVSVIISIDAECKYSWEVTASGFSLLSFAYFYFKSCF